MTVKQFWKMENNILKWCGRGHVCVDRNSLSK